MAPSDGGAGAVVAALLPNAKVWVNSETESWIGAEVVKTDGESVTVRLGKETKSFPAKDVYLAEPRTAAGVEDMVKLSYLHEPGVLHNLGFRYSMNEIYTYTGNILIAVNPFQRLPHLYNEIVMNQYRGAVLGELSPHVFAIADAAYRAMRNENISQSILVSGESGAGKTETTKLIMRYLAYQGAATAAALSVRRGESDRPVEQQVLESNPLLEAFGNAKTIRNDNSSRFGASRKYMEIQFNAQGAISGAAIRTYLLERSRVVSITDPERNYHIFYQLCYGASEDEVAAWRLKPAKEFYYLNQSKCFDLEGVSNAEEYQATRKAMSVVGITEEEQGLIFQTVAAILHVGNMSFAAGPEDSSVLSGPTATEAAESAAALLGVHSDQLVKALTTRTIKTREGDILKTLDVASAQSSRDSLAKILYAALFDWLVDKINKSIGQDPDSKFFIGVLDIYGFESFKANSFEQFCINLANEKLQQHFNQHVFKMEQARHHFRPLD